MEGIKQSTSWQCGKKMFCRKKRGRRGQKEEEKTRKEAEQEEGEEGMGIGRRRNEE
jgi:hypothetical protein